MSDDLDDWLSAAIPLHERLSATAASLVANMLKKGQIEFLSITARTKSIEGALEKIKRKEYDKPRQQLTDLSGIRIVTYLEEQATKISSIIKNLFEVDEANSHDRSAYLGEDRIGYRSTHFVCTLGKERASLPEHEGIGSLKFEVQIRTVLQHAWAELAHDRSFKFGVVLPSKIQRKLNLYSGMLEVVDSAFDDIAKEIDAYRSGLEHKTLTQISTTEINSISLGRFISTLRKELEIRIDSNVEQKLFDELKKFGLQSIGDLRSLVTPDFKRNFRQHFSSTTSFGVLRALMMYHDMDRYFGLGRNFDGMSPHLVNFLATKYPPGEVHDWLKRLGISVLEADIFTVPAPGRTKSTRKRKFD